MTRGPMRLKGRVAIVTGGGKGIGKATSLAFAREGAAVAVAGRTLSALQETCDEIKSKGGNAKPVQTDVTIEEQVIRMVSETLKAFGKVDILVNNSGVAGPIVRLADMDLARWNETIAVDLTGSMLSCREVLKYMIPQRKGAIINIVSLAGTAGDGKSGFPLRSAYCAAKMGLIAITETLAIEVGEYNIRVNAVSPGPVKGEHITNAMMGKARATNRPFEEIMKDLAAGSSLKRISEESEIASVVVFLASDEASAITGQTLPVTCGQHINF
ncbi:MAG TPA: SDR family NAD(P)-dependent oxidoreductase [Syntrophorhabdales bacterium]|nr:SDR family NAD(P)-dependent oxidoreductase [Syntrophorhabdales bacterium]